MESCTTVYNAPLAMISSTPWKRCAIPWCGALVSWRQQSANRQVFFAEPDEQVMFFALKTDSEDFVSDK